jgi:hypothetical protein
MGRIMRITGLTAAAGLAVLLSACGNNQPPAPQASSSAAPSSVAQVSSQQPAPNPTPADNKALKPLLGSWGLDPANCGDQVLKVSQAKFEGPGSGCDISGWTDNGDGTYTAAMTCTASGQTSTERIQMRPIFAPSGEGIELIYLDRKNLSSTVLRCQAAK